MFSVCPVDVVSEVTVPVVSEVAVPEDVFVFAAGVSQAARTNRKMSMQSERVNACRNLEEVFVIIYLVTILFY